MGFFSFWKDLAYAALLFHEDLREDIDVEAVLAPWVDQYSTNQNKELKYTSKVTQEIDKIVRLASVFNLNQFQRYPQRKDLSWILVQSFEFVVDEGTDVVKGSNMSGVAEHVCKTVECLEGVFSNGQLVSNRTVLVQIGFGQQMVVGKGGSAGLVR